MEVGRSPLNLDVSKSLYNHVRRRAERYVCSEVRDYGFMGVKLDF